MLIFDNLFDRDYHEHLSYQRQPVDRALRSTSLGGAFSATSDGGCDASFWIPSPLNRGRSAALGDRSAGGSVTCCRRSDGGNRAAAPEQLEPARSVAPTRARWAIASASGSTALAATRLAEAGLPHAGWQVVELNHVALAL